MKQRLLARGIDLVAAIGAVVSTTCLFIYTFPTSPRDWFGEVVMGSGSFLALWAVYRGIALVFPRPWVRLALTVALALSAVVLGLYDATAFRMRSSPLPDDAGDPNLAFVFGPANQVIVGLAAGACVVLAASAQRVVSALKQRAA